MRPLVLTHINTRYYEDNIRRADYLRYILRTISKIRATELELALCNIIRKYTLEPPRGILPEGKRVVVYMEAAVSISPIVARARDC